MADYTKYPTVAISDLDSTEVVTLSNTLIVDQYDATRKATLSSVLSSLGIMRCIFFSEGGTLGSKKDVALYEEDGILYTWNGSYPKAVEAGSTPETSGGIGLGAWVSVGDAVLRGELADEDGLKLIGNCPNISKLRDIEPTKSKQRIFVVEHTSGLGIGGGYFYYDNTDTSSTDDDGVVIVTSGGKRWKRECTYISTDFYGLVAGTVVDMSSALNKALQAAKNSKYKRLVCTTGTFYVNATLKVPSGVTLSGSGNYASAIMALPTMPITENVIQNEKHVYQVFGTDYDENIHIENITIDANNRARNTSETWVDATQGTTILLSTVRNSSIKKMLGTS